MTAPVLDTKKPSVKETVVEREVPLYQDIFRPVLKSGTPVLKTTGEQDLYIQKVLEKCCSDSQFARKCYEALKFILTAGSEVPVAATATSLTPTTAALGSPDFTLHVHGTGFTAASKIVWNGTEEPTTMVSDTELTTMVNMATATVPVDIPVSVTGASGTLTFSLTAAAALAFTTTPPVTKK